MNQCSGCGREISWPLKTCGACAQEFFKQTYAPIAGPIQKLAHCSKCNELTMCVEHGYEWLCSRCKPAEVVRKSVQDGHIQKVDKEPPKPTRKPRTNSGYRLSANVRDEDRKMVLAQRVLEYLRDAGGRLWLSRLYYLMSAWRYGSDWRAAWGLLITTGAVTVLNNGKHRQLVLISEANPFYRWRLIRRRKHKARSRGRSEWFRERFG
jgi:hypothetical protein